VPLHKSTETETKGKAAPLNVRMVRLPASNTCDVNMKRSVRESTPPVLLAEGRLVQIRKWVL
jgi:hypothetical protein